MAIQTDPVCGMQVEEGREAGRAEHEGVTYYFCSTGCKDKFEENPEGYASQ